jgi:hypothetical protein
MTLVWRPGFQFDADASTYIEAVEAADTQALETGVRYAINDFVIGCKNDGIWSAIKASCILAGARTLQGCLVPLVGTAPTSFNFAAGDYNRETGLKGDGSSKYLNANRNNNADPQNNKHASLYISSPETVFNNTRLIVAGDSTASDLHIVTGVGSPGNYLAEINAPVVANTTISQTTTGFIGATRNNSASIIFRGAGSNVPIAQASTTPRSIDTTLYAGIGESSRFSNARFAFYSIGESLDLALLDARVTTLINAIGAAIP